MVFQDLQFGNNFPEIKGLAFFAKFSKTINFLSFEILTGGGFFFALKLARCGRQETTVEMDAETWKQMRHRLRSGKIYE